MAAGDLTTLLKLKDYLGEKGTEKDPLFKSMISSSSAWIKNWLNRDLTAQAYTWPVDGHGGMGLYLPQTPVVSVDGVSVDGVAWTPSQWKLAGNVLYRADGNPWPKGWGNIVVTFTAGFATVPADISQAVCELVAWRLHERNNTRKSTGAVGGETINFQTTDLPPAVATLLSNWRKVWPT